MEAQVDELNSAQRAAARYGIGDDGVRTGVGPLLIIAGAGSGKTTTLAHRVAYLIAGGADPRRILMLTFTRRAAAEMSRRAERVLAAPYAGRDAGSLEAKSTAARARVLWSGTFHAIANRLLRLHAESVGLDPSFTVLDRSDSADLMDLIRNELGLAKQKARFPRKSTCLAIYSHTINSQRPLEETLERAFPWCESWGDELRRLFAAYTEAKQAQYVLDYDDLLLYWYHLMAEPALAAAVGRRFDHVLVDEYQDTNTLQAEVLKALKPDGVGVTVVGDDAQSIYSFRAATVRNILDFPTQFDPPAEVIMLEQNYRSTRPILEASNGVIALARERFTKNLFSTRASEQRPILATVEDEACQADYVVERVLEHREAGLELKRQAVLFRTSHHSDQLEVELARRNIPFVKFGGLKFLEAAHVKDMLCVLRWVENPRDRTAAFRVLQLLPGIGPASARAAIDHLEQSSFDLGSLGKFKAPSSASDAWGELCELLVRLRAQSTDWRAQPAMVRRWYEPYLQNLYDSAPVRAADLEQLEQIAASYVSRERFLTELTLDPPSATGDEAGVPLLDEDYLILSTIHSAKGQEWDAVFVLNVADGCIPSDMATGTPEEVEEERRLLYVAMTRARDDLHLIHPLRFFKRQQHRFGDGHIYSPRSRFIDDELLACFERCSYRRDSGDGDAGELDGGRTSPRVDVGARLRGMWQ